MKCLLFPPQPDDVHPDKIWVKEAPSKNMSAEAREFLQLEQAMTDHFESEHTPQMGITNPDYKVIMSENNEIQSNMDLEINVIVF